MAGEIADAIIAVLSALVPDSDGGKLAAAGIFSLLVLFVLRVLKPEWVALCLRHIYRWLRCKLTDRHYYQQSSAFGSINIYTGRRTGTFTCYVCGKTITIT